MIHGCDISRWQGDVNWDLIKSTFDFAIFKTSEGCPDPGQTAGQYADPKFHRNQLEARRVGIARGYYHYARPDAGNLPEAEADCFCDNVGKLQAGEIMVLDFEVKWGGNVVDWCKRFLDKVQQRTGVKPLIYLNFYLSNSYNWHPVSDAGYGLWLAKYDMSTDQTVVRDWDFAAMKQYSSSGSGAGITPLDIDVFYGTVDQFKAYGFKAPVATPAPKPTPEPAPQPQDDGKDAQIADLTAKLQDSLQKQNESQVKISESIVQVSVLKNDVSNLTSQNDNLKKDMESANVIIMERTQTIKELQAQIDSPSTVSVGKSYGEKIVSILSSPRFHQLVIAVLSQVVASFGYLNPGIANAITVLLTGSVVVGTVDKIGNNAAKPQ